ncbi:MAG TPA: methyltransferase domain-containing protein [Pyrinomonadaceae bacterium]|nr:methyltransferase domain-containing protein [Pyrinomonadaceae bacterium]
MTVSTNWYEDFFHGVPLDLWRKAISPEQTIAEADFLVKALCCDAGSHLLDVPCGNGRLSLELARRGYRVTGVDISVEFINEAQSQRKPPATAGGTDKARASANPPANAGGTDLIAPVEFILGDMRRIEGEAIYDGAYCFGNSFGFLAYADMEKFLSGVARALKPGARFIIETGMAAESAIPKFEELASHQIEDILLTIKEKYLAEESCIDTEYVFERNGVSESRLAKHWIYTAAEIRRMLERAGFDVREVFGSLKCEPFVLGSGELFVVARRGVSLAIEPAQKATY